MWLKPWRSATFCFGHTEYKTKKKSWSLKWLKNCLSFLIWRKIKIGHSYKIILSYKRILYTLHTAFLHYPKQKNGGITAEHKVKNCVFSKPQPQGEEKKKFYTPPYLSWNLPHITTRICAALPSKENVKWQRVMDWQFHSAVSRCCDNKVLQQQ